MNTHRGTRLDGLQQALILHDVGLTDRAVVEEARRWSTGIRGAIADDVALADADLTPFVLQAMSVGTMAISGAGGIQETANVHRLIDDLERRTDSAMRDASAATSRAVSDAAAILKTTTEEARVSFETAAGASRTSIKETVDEARDALNAEIRRLIGGENPELLGKLAPLLERFGHDLDARAGTQTEELIAKVARQFDPDDPTSPMSKQTREIGRRQQELADSLGQGQKAIEATVAELTKEFALTRASKAAAAASSTTLKGTTFESAIHRLVDQIAVGLGDAYTDTGATIGKGSTSKKGDGVLTVEGSDIRIVLEMTDSPRKDWNNYLAQAERNRDAVASIGLARTPEQLGGHTVRTFGPRRIVLAFDPEMGDANLLRAVIQVVRVSAIAAGRRQDDQEIATAQESVEEAIGLLDRFDSIKRTAAVITNNAKKVDSEAGSLAADLGNVLVRAQRALAHGTGDHGHEAA